MQGVDICYRDFFSSVDRSRCVRVVHQRLLIKIIHRIGTTIMIHPRRLRNHQRVVLVPKILAKSIRVDFLNIRFFGLVVCGHGEEEASGWGGELVDGEAHEGGFVGGIVGERLVDAVVVEDGDPGVRFD